MSRYRASGQYEPIQGQWSVWAGAGPVVSMSWYRASGQWAGTGPVVSMSQYRASSQYEPVLGQYPTYVSMFTGMTCTPVMFTGMTCTLLHDVYRNDLYTTTWPFLKNLGPNVNFDTVISGSKNCNKWVSSWYEINSLYSVSFLPWLSVFTCHL